MAGRLSPPRDPVTFTLDGERIVAERGEPVAAALVAAGKSTLARSPKFHRPRGPACMRAACDGCLARVNGAPNVMTCMVPAEEGLEVTTQNSLGSREVDLLRVTDWFFPDGMNHHELFAGIPGAQAAVLAFAGRVAGLGQLPDVGRATTPSARRQVEVLVVGGGPAGMAAATAAASRGLRVEVVDDALTPGGGARGLGVASGSALAAVRDGFDRAVAEGRVRMRSRTIAAGVFGRDVIVVEPDGGGRAEVLEPRALIIAAGAHDGGVPFENNDSPGVMSARAACLLVASGVSPGDSVVLLVPPGAPRDPRELTFGDAFERVMRTPPGGGPPPRVTRVEEVVAAKGSSGLRAVVVRSGGEERSLPADALLVDAVRAPAYELCEQAGATLTHGPAGYAPVVDRGRIAEATWAIGEVTGAPLIVEEFVRAAAEIAEQLASPVA